MLRFRLGSSEGSRFQLPSLVEAVYTAEDDVASLKSIRSVPPHIFNHLDLSLGANLRDQTTCDFDFQGAFFNVSLRAADESVKVRVLDPIFVEQDVVEETEVRELLRDMRAAAIFAEIFTGG